MKIALLIHSFAGAKDTLARHWPHFRKSGYDIFGVDRIGGGTWPEKVPTKEIGVNSYIMGDNLCRRLVDTYRWFLTDPQFAPYSHAMIVEYDTVFRRTPPDLTGHRVAGHLAGYVSPPMKALKYYHCPWLLSREAARVFVRECDHRVRLKDYELGHPDFFFGYVWQCLNIPVQHLDGTWSQNEIWVEHIPMIKADNPWFVHGIKNEAMLKAVLTP